MTDDRTPPTREPQDYTVAFSPRQIGGFVLVAALLIAVARRVRRRRGKA